MCILEGLPGGWVGVESIPLIQLAVWPAIKVWVHSGTCMCPYQSACNLIHYIIHLIITSLRTPAKFFNWR